MVEYVWMVIDHVRAELISLGAHASVVKYRKDGHTYITVVTNDEFNFMKEDLDDTD